MMNFRKKVILGVLSICFAVLIAGTALATSASFHDVYVPGTGNFVDIPSLKGTVAYHGSAYISSSGSNKSFNYALWTQEGVNLTGWLNLDPGYAYTFSGVPDTNGQLCVFKVGTSFFELAGSAGGSGWF